MVPAAAPVASGGKKALLGSALRDLTSVLARPAGAAGGRGKLSGAVGSILSLALDNNANGLFAQPQGIFDFGECLLVRRDARPRFFGERERERGGERREKPKGKKKRGKL